MSLQQNLHFSNALTAWMKRNGMQPDNARSRAQAATYLQISAGDLRRYLNGSLPRQDTIEAILTRIADQKPLVIDPRAKQTA